MGSFAGHIDEGIVFIILGVWWIYKMFQTYIECGEDIEKYRSHLSYYTVWRDRKLPLELILKILFPAGGLMAELIDSDFSFVNDDGKFYHLTNILHTTILTMFLLHGVIDLMCFYKLPVIKEMKYFSFIIAMSWYGIAFYYHSEPGMNKPPLENTIHRLPISTMFAASAAALAEFYNRRSILPQMFRCLCILTLGTWFTFSSFVLFNPSPFPGSHSNPAWDRNEETNVQFIVAAFGMHLIGNLFFMVAVYIIMASYRTWARCLKGRQERSYSYSKVSVSVEDGRAEKYGLLEFEDNEF